MRYQFELSDNTHYIMKASDTEKNKILSAELDKFDLTIDDYYLEARKKKASYDSSREVWTYSFEL